MHSSCFSLSLFFLFFKMAKVDSVRLPGSEKREESQSQSPSIVIYCLLIRITVTAGQHEIYIYSFSTLDIGLLQTASSIKDIHCKRSQFFLDFGFFSDLCDRFRFEVITVNTECTISPPKQSIHEFDRGFYFYLYLMSTALKRKRNTTLLSNSLLCISKNGRRKRKLDVCVCVCLPLFSRRRCLCCSYTHRCGNGTYHSKK